MRTLLVLLPLALTARSAAGLDADAAVPYRWRVVVRFTPHPQLTPAFRGQVVRDVQAALASEVGGVAVVEVADLAMAPPALAADPLVAAFAARGWPALEDPRFRDLTGVKTHFLTVAAAAQGVTLAARQHDGTTGLCTPAVRTKLVADWPTVSREAGLLVGREFGPVGTIDVTGYDGVLVTVAFRGGALPGFPRLVRAGDVFAVAAVLRGQRPAAPAARPGAGPAPPALFGQPREVTLMRAESDVVNGTCRCRVLSQVKTPFPMTRSVDGFRCLKLATVERPVEIRLVDKAGNPPPAATMGLLQVRASDIDFLPRTDGRDRLDYRNGLFRSARPMRGVACVVVNLGTAAEQLFPLPVTGPGPLVVRFDANPQAAARAAIELAVDDFRGRVIDARRAQATLVDDLGRLILAGKNDDALKRAVGGLEALDAQDKPLAEELAKLTAQAAADPQLSAGVAAAGQALAGLQADRTATVRSRVDDLRQSLAKSNDPARFEKEFRAKELAARVRQLLDAGEVPDALDHLDQLYELTQKPAVKEQRAKVAAEWEVKSPAHAKAREYIAGPWRKAVTLPDLVVGVERLTDAAATLTKHDDRLGLRLLLASVDVAYSRLKDIIDRLDPGPDADLAAKAEVQRVTKAVREVETAARAAVARLENPAKP